MPFILNFCFFFLPGVNTPLLKSRESSRRFTTSNLYDFMDSTHKNYLVKLWAQLSAKKTPVVRRERWGEAASEHYTASDKKRIGYFETRLCQSYSLTGVS